jgi:hypothetical protein
MDQEKPSAFLVDSMLGRLARWLRILGFDTWYFREIADRELLDLHRSTGRVLLTRDTRLVQCMGIGRHVLVRSNGWRDQLREVVLALSLKACRERIFTRCPVCNRLLDGLKEEEVLGRVPDYVACSTNLFQGCHSCGKVYWAGTHRKGMEEEISMLFADRQDDPDSSTG